MKRPVRTVLFAAFITLFLVGAPAVVLYTAGYRYNPRNGHIVRTGVLSVSSTPRGAHILFDNVDTGRTTPYVFNRITPGAYQVTLTHDDYHTYVDDVIVESGKSAYVSGVALFAVGEPLLLNEESGDVTPAVDGNTALVVRNHTAIAEAWRYSIRNRSYTLLASANDFFSVPTSIVELREGENAIEVRNVQSPDTLLSLLPIADYTIAFADGPYAVLTTPDDALYVIDIYAGQPIALSTTATAWSTHNGMLVWTDGVEVNTFSFSSHATTFITRQSAPIVDVALDTNSTTVFVATATTVQSLTVDDNGTQVTTLATMNDIEQCWTSGNAQSSLFVLGTVNDVRGFYELGLR